MKYKAWFDGNSIMDAEEVEAKSPDQAAEICADLGGQDVGTSARYCVSDGEKVRVYCVTTEIEYTTRKCGERSHAEMMAEAEGE